LEDVRAFRGKCAGRWLLDHGMPAVVEEFKGVGGVCAVAVGAPNTDNAWVQWLDCLRREGLAHVSAEVEFQSRHTERRPDPNFEVVAAGLVFFLEEIRPDPDAGIIRIDLLDIDDVCGASERVCRRLADEALKRELAVATNGPLSPVSASVSTAAPNQPAAAPDRSQALTVKQAAAALNVSEDTLHRMRHRDVIKMFKPGKHWRVLASEVRRLREQPRFKDR
jgi:excisionase family DNA binding protein